MYPDVMHNSVDYTVHLKHLAINNAVPTVVPSVPEDPGGLGSNQIPQDRVEDLKKLSLGSNHGSEGFLGRGPFVRDACNKD